MKCEPFFPKKMKKYEFTVRPTFTMCLQFVYLFLSSWAISRSSSAITIETSILPNSNHADASHMKLSFTITNPKLLPTNNLNWCFSLINKRHSWHATTLCSSINPNIDIESYSQEIDGLPIGVFRLLTYLVELDVDTASPPDLNFRGGHEENDIVSGSLSERWFTVERERWR